jgi:8-oxo-dGTP pyrophosphatase MutT (NUDIX family)
MKDGTAIILVNGKKEVLLQHRTDDAENFPGMWSFFGGGIEENETPLETVKRECFEELEYDLKNPKLILVKNLSTRKIFLFIEKYNPSKKLVLKEGQGMKWFKVEEISKVKNTFSKETLKELKEIIDSQT